MLLLTNQPGWQPFPEGPKPTACWRVSPAGVHLKHIGHPLLIDPLYNAPPRGTPTGIFLSKFKWNYKASSGQQERPLIDRLTLHAEKLRFAHLNGSTMELQAPLHKDFRAVLNALKRHS